jgi:hypothetical protein
MISPGTVTGVFRVNNRTVDGATAYLVPAELFATGPAAGDAIPSGYIGTCTTGPQNGSDGSYRFDSVPQAEYWVGFSFYGSTAFEYTNVSALTLGASGKLTVSVADNTFDAIKIHRTNNVSGDIGLAYSDPVSGLCWTIRHSGRDRFARNSLQIFNQVKTDHYGALSDTPVFELDDDGQAHVFVLDTVSNNVSSPLRFEKYLLSGSPAAGIGHSIEFSCQNSVGGGSIFAHIQARMVNVTSGAEDGTLEFRTNTNGVSRHRFKINETGVVECNSQDDAGADNARFGIFQRAHGDPNYGLVSLGNAGFTGGTNHFSGPGGTFYAANASGDFVGTYCNFQQLGVEKFKVNYNGQTIATFVDADPTASPYPMKLVHNSGTSGQTAGGVGLQFASNSRDGTSVEFAAIQITAAGMTPLKTTMNFAISSGGVTRQVVKIDELGTLIARFDFQHAGVNFGACGATPVPRQAVSGSRGSNAALASVLTALANLGLITDGSS